ncbi:MAG: NAD(P)/FAD-dependent oxidoreductase [Actinomycetota bacterium]
MHYDVAVIGAGPGGCAAARGLSARGFKVLLLEKDRIPRDKTCMGLLLPGGRRVLEEGFGPLPPECLEVPGEVLGVTVLSEGGGEYRLPFPEGGTWIRRTLLDAFLARSSGAEVWDGCRVVDVTPGRFHVRLRFLREGVEEEVEATYLVGADGAESLVSRILRPEFHRLYAGPSLRRVMLVLSEGEADWDPRWLGVVLRRQGPYLQRFFVRGGTVGIAVSYGGKVHWQQEMEWMHEYLSRRLGLRLRGEPVRLSSASNCMGAGGRFNLGAGSAILVGEAAGFLDPWGFGIQLALESGRLAAESILESAGENVTPHLHYRRRVQPLLEDIGAAKRGSPGKLGGLEISGWSGLKSFASRRDLRAVRRRLGR